MIVEYEFHKKTPHNITDLFDKIKSMGFKIYAELEEEGLELGIMNGDGSHIPFEMKIYEKGSEDGMYEYQIITKNKDNFMKLYDIFVAM